MTEASFHRDDDGNVGVDFGDDGNFRKNFHPTLPALPTLSGGSAYTDPTLDELIPTLKGIFLREDDKGTLKLAVDSEAGLVLAEKLRGRFAFCASAGVWHCFVGTHWEPLLTSAIADQVIARILFHGTSPIGFRQSYLNGVVSIITKANLIPPPKVPSSSIPFKNGLLDTVTRALSPVTHANAATWCIPHAYRQGSDCPMFKLWLRSALGGDPGLVRLIRAFIAAVITGRADLQMFLFLQGPGGTGKSTFIRLLFAILGPSNCMTTNLRELEQNRFETAGVYGKRLVAITDSDKYGGSLNVLKALTGQDPVRNERKHVQQSGTFVFGGMVLIASNEPLQSTDYTSGLSRRRLVIEFKERLSPQARAEFAEKGGEERLHQEISEIINWALELRRDEVTDIFMNPPKLAAKASFDAMTAQNPVAEWIADSLVPERDFVTQIGVKKEIKGSPGAFEDADMHLFPNYLTWCRQSGREALALRRFRHAVFDMVKTLGFDVIETRRSFGQCLQGVRLRRIDEDVFPWHGIEVQDSSYTNTDKVQAGTRASVGSGGSAGISDDFVPKEKPSKDSGSGTYGASSGPCVNDEPTTEARMTL